MGYMSSLEKTHRIIQKYTYFPPIYHLYFQLNPCFFKRRYIIGLLTRISYLFIQKYRQFVLIYPRILALIYKETFFNSSMNTIPRVVTKKSQTIRLSIYIDITFLSIYYRQRVISFFSNGFGLLIGAQQLNYYILRVCTYSWYNR